MKAVVGYARLSRSRDESTSIARQHEAIRRKADAQGWTLLDIVDDVDVSASRSRLRRPGLDRVRSMVTRGEADAIVVWRLDRVARSVADVSVLLDEGLQLVATDQDFDTTTSTGRAMVQVAQVFAELEAKTIGERTASMRAHLAKERKHAGPAPYGYRIVPHPSGQGRALEVDPEEREHLRAAVDVVMEGGGAYAAQKILRERGAKPRRAAEWSVSSVQVVLRGDAILGRVKHRGQLLLDEDGYPEQVWEPIVTSEEAKALREALAARPVGTRRRRATRLLSGLVTCADCGGRMRVSSTGAGGAPVFSYSCRALTDGRRCDAPSSINADILEDHVTRTLLSKLGRLEVVERRQVNRDSARRAEIDLELARCGSAITTPDADVRALADRISALQTERAGLSNSVAVEEIATGETYQQRWSRAETTEAKRKLLDLALDGKISVRRGTRGRRGLDPTRLSVPWVWEPESWLERGWVEDFGAGESSGPPPFNKTRRA
ncbi:MAG: recombinase family protein [Aeromicrobium erythreum]